MGTTLRAEVSKDNPYWISRHRYYELKHFCLQYHYWMEQLRSIEMTYHAPLQTIVQNGEFNDPVYKAAEKRERYLTWMKMVEDAIRSTTPSVTLGDLLLKGITKGISYDILAVNDSVPCGKDVYYNLYRRFFYELDKLRG